MNSLPIQEAMRFQINTYLNEQNICFAQFIDTLKYYQKSIQVDVSRQISNLINYFRLLMDYDFDLSNILLEFRSQFESIYDTISNLSVKHLSSVLKFVKELLRFNIDYFQNVLKLA